MTMMMIYPCTIVADVESSDNSDDEVSDQLPVVPRSVCRIVVTNASRIVDDEHNVALLAAFCTQSMHGSDAADLTL